MMGRTKNSRGGSEPRPTGAGEAGDALTAETFERLRPRLFGIAYRMLGSASDAEDIVQDAYVRCKRALDEGVTIGSLRAYLATAVTRLSIDHLRSARVRREQYVGMWLPEPLVGEIDESDGAGATWEAESLSMAFLLLLERLGPAERAAFLLHEVFDYGYDEISRILGKSEANCRQLVARARRRVRTDRPRYDATPQQRGALAARFFDCVQSGDLCNLVKLLADDVVAYGDGGGKAPQWSRPVSGVVPVGRLFAGLGRQIASRGLQLEPCQVNGQPGAIVRDGQGRLVNVLALEIDAVAVRTIRSVINPDKLRHLGPVADIWALLGRTTPGG
ncbi:MAG TPA: RNA polymerase sigma-70 factor [Rhizobiaceae bacterium]|nr:RNA polymerase sigma-70 factor [Rhizobiaceae bacterium]